MTLPPAPRRQDLRAQSRVLHVRGGGHLQTDIALLDGEPVADTGPHKTTIGVDGQFVLDVIAAAPGELQSRDVIERDDSRVGIADGFHRTHRRAAQLPRNGLRARRRAQHAVAVEHDEQGAANALRALRDLQAQRRTRREMERLC